MANKLTTFTMALAGAGTPKALSDATPAVPSKVRQLFFQSVEGNDVELVSNSGGDLLITGATQTFDTGYMHDILEEANNITVDGDGNISGGYLL